MAAANQRNRMYVMKHRCSICLGKFNVQRQLPCLHSFCQGCLEDYISSQAAKVQELKDCECPICRTVVPIPRKGKYSKKWASLFPINSVLESIQGKQNEEVHRACDCCLSDGISVTAHGFCVVCEEAMCETCLTVHKRQKATKDHSIVTIEAVLNNPKNALRFDKGFHCQEHVGEKLKFYCKEHKSVCCANCCIIHHRNCSQVLDLRKDANNLLQELKPLKIIKEMNKLENHLLNFEKINDSTIISIDSQVQEITNKIKEIRKTLNGLLDNLERRVKSEGNQLAKQEAILKQKENHTCQALLKAVRNSHVTLETVMKHGSDTQRFITADRMISQVQFYYEQIKEKFCQTETVILNLELDPQIQYVLEQMGDIGKVICRKERGNLHLSRAEKPLNEHQLEIEKVVEIKGPDDKPPMYTGITHIPGDQLMLADWNNKRVILLDSSYQYIASLTVPGDPWDICVVDHQEVAVSLPYQKKLQYMSVTSGIIKPTRMLKTRYGFWGIASAGKGNIAVSGSCNDEGKHYWGLVTSGGEGDSCYRFDCQCKPSSTYVALNGSFTRVYITIWNASSLYCFAMNGKRMYVYNPDSLKGPEKVTTDRDDNVYLAGCLSHNIHQLESDGTPIRIITKGIPSHPNAICFNNSGDMFVIGSSCSEARTIYVLRFSKN